LRCFSTGNKGVLNCPDFQEKSFDTVIIATLLFRTNASIAASKILNAIVFNHIVGLLKVGTAEHSQNLEIKTLRRKRS
jgi:hypothetical protein